MSASVPCELVRDAIARIGSDGRLAPVTAAMRDWLVDCASEAEAIGSLEALPLAATDRVHLLAGDEVTMAVGDDHWRLRIVAAADAQWLQVVPDEQRARVCAEPAHCARARSLATYVGGLAHDLNNHLGGALGLSAQLRPFVRGADDLRMLDELEAATKIGSRLVGVLARMLVRGVGQRRSIAPGELLTDVLALVRKLIASQGVEMPVAVASGLPPIRTVPEAATQALMQGLAAVAACGPHSLALQMSAGTAHVGGGRARACVVLSCTAKGLPEPTLTQLVAIVGAHRGMLMHIAAAPDWLEGLAGALLIQRRLGADLTATVLAAGVLRLDYVWPTLPGSA